MKKEMALPRYYGLVRLVAQIGAVLGCLAGVVVMFISFAAFQFGFIAGISAMFNGVVIIILSLAGLGISYCFLAIVKAQIDTRNAIIKYISLKQET